MMEFEEKKKNYYLVLLSDEAEKWVRSYVPVPNENHDITSLVIYLVNYTAATELYAVISKYGTEIAFQYSEVVTTIYHTEKILPQLLNYNTIALWNYIFKKDPQLADVVIAWESYWLSTKGTISKNV